MALPIAPTPVLCGKSADRFERILRENEKRRQVLSAPALNMSQVEETLKRIRARNNEFRKS